MKEFTPHGRYAFTGKTDRPTWVDATNISKELLQDFIDDVESGDIKLNIDRTFQLDEVAAAPPVYGR